MAQRLQIRGDDKLLATFADINDFDAWATPPIMRGIKRLHEVVQTYPPERPDSKYVRTFTLQRSIDWDVQSSPQGVTGVVFSHGADQGYGPYEGFVKVEGFQAEIHAGYWPTDKDDLDTVEPYIMDEMSKATAEVLRGN